MKTENPNEKKIKSKKTELWYSLEYKDYGNKNQPFFQIPTAYIKIFKPKTIYRLKILIHDNSIQKVIPITAKVRNYKGRNPQLVPLGGVHLPFDPGKSYLIHINGVEKK
jgi:hypothetical protein